MRISDWTSDVCSSDLFRFAARTAVAERKSTAAAHVEGIFGILAMRCGDDEPVFVVGDRQVTLHVLDLGGAQPDLPQDVGAFFAVYGTRPHEGRSEERRVGKECVSTCRSRWSP